MGSFDIIREFRLDNYEVHSGTVTEVQGSNHYQTAYKLEREANLTIKARDAFPRGVPHQFSFECTYRQRQPQPDPWHLFHLTNSYEDSQLSISMNPVKKTLELSLPEKNGELQKVEFRHSAVSNLTCFSTYLYLM